MAWSGVHEVLLFWRYGLFRFKIQNTLLVAEGNWFNNPDDMVWCVFKQDVDCTESWINVVFPSNDLTCYGCCNLVWLVTLTYMLKGNSLLNSCCFCGTCCGMLFERRLWQETHTDLYVHIMPQVLLSALLHILKSAQVNCLSCLFLLWTPASTNVTMNQAQLQCFVHESRWYISLPTADVSVSVVKHRWHFQLECFWKWNKRNINCCTGRYRK